mmetsp:Transcript_9330/g.15345  ORF Transcript_9330/g.15345 Transcript_9330/m.15345 type:complete len:119 (+) Transcript_9330:1469-1825(+)
MAWHVCSSNHLQAGQARPALHIVSRSHHHHPPRIDHLKSSLALLFRNLMFRSQPAYRSAPQRSTSDGLTMTVQIQKNEGQSVRWFGLVWCGVVCSAILPSHHTTPHFLLAVTSSFRSF